MKGFMTAPFSMDLRERMRALVTHADADLRTGPVEASSEPIGVLALPAEDHFTAGLGDPWGRIEDTCLVHLDDTANFRERRTGEDCPDAVWTIWRGGRARGRGGAVRAALVALPQDRSHPGR